MADKEKTIEIPEENIYDASGFTKINTTLPDGDWGSVEELDKSLEKNPEVRKS